MSDFGAGDDVSWELTAFQFQVSNKLEKKTTPPGEPLLLASLSNTSR